MRSVMQHSFATVPRANIPRSSFNRSSGLKTTFDADYLVPIFCDDVLPGDTFNMNATFFARLATPLHPIMDNLYLETFWFFVPNRLVWDNWERLCGAQDDPGDSIDFTVPVFAGTINTNIEPLFDYFGLPVGDSAFPGSQVNAMPFRAYNLIWADWFRDQNLQDSPTLNTTDSALTFNANYVLQKRGKRHDYFTSALPAPQRGDAVSVLGGYAPVLGIGLQESAAPGTTSANLRETSNTSTQTYINYAGASGANFQIQTADGNSPSEPKIFADLAGSQAGEFDAAAADTINDLRLAFQTQRLLERDARSGTRYNETILAHFGVTVPDFRVQRPEFLGGGSTRMNITPVANTSEDATSKQGDLTGFGTASGTHGFTKSFVEHGYVIGLVNARADLTYSQGIDRHWSKSTRFDFYYPVLSQIGEQSILNKEIYFDNGSSDDMVFGYTERYNEYRYKPSKLTGLFRPGVTGSLDVWHLSEEFANLPTLGDTFIQSNTGTPLDRAIAVPSEPQFIADFYFDLKCARPMPLHGVPGMLDHF